MKPKALSALLLAGIVLTPATPGVTAQVPGEAWSHAATLEREYPALRDALIRLEQARGVAFGELAMRGEALREGRRQTASFESDLVGRLTALVGDQGAAAEAADEAVAGYAVLGARAAEIIAWGNAFYREVVGILADPTIADRRDERRTALSMALERYRSRPDIALPGAPKDMDILYDHPHALAFRTTYPELDGLIWAGLWLHLAATEPLTDFPDRDVRAAGIDTVTSRFHAKLSYGEPPQSFPSQIPLAPAIAPGLIFLSPEAAMIWDNLVMMQEVLADILASPAVTDVPGTLDQAVDQFLDPTDRLSQRGVWESMALQHGIFFQGGFPLGVMTKSELNGDPHAAHRGAAGGPIIMPGGGPG